MLFPYSTQQGDKGIAAAAAVRTGLGREVCRLVTVVSVTTAVPIAGVMGRELVLISLSPARPVGPDLNHRAGARRAKAGAALKLP